MELRHLEYLVALGEELHFGRAADKMNITQPALSRQIQQLEAEMDVRLFERTKRKVALTTAGAHFFDEALYITKYLNRVVQSTKRRAAGEEGEIRIGFVGSAMQNIIPELLVKLNEEYPHLHTSLEELSNKEQLRALANDQLDIGFLRMNRVMGEFERKVVREESFSLVVPKDSHLTPDIPIDWSKLGAEPFILFSRDYSPEYFDNIMSIFSDHDIEPVVSHRSVHANTIFRLVENHLGVAIIPSSLALGVALDVTFIPLNHLPQQTKLTAVWKPNNRNTALNRLLDLL